MRPHIFYEIWFKGCNCDGEPWQYRHSIVDAAEVFTLGTGPALEDAAKRTGQNWIVFYQNNEDVLRTYRMRRTEDGAIMEMRLNSEPSSPFWR